MMKLETSATVRLCWAVIFLAPAVMLMGYGLAIKGLEGIAALGFGLLLIAAKLFSSWWKLRRRMQVLDYQARSLGREVRPS